MKNTVRTLEEGRRSFFKRALAGGVVTGATLSTLGAHMALAQDDHRFSHDGEILFVIQGSDSAGTGMTMAIWGPWERGPL